MGSSSSKASRAAGAAARQYPKRVPPTSQPTTNVPPPPPPAPNRPPGPTVRPPPSAADSRSEAINLDASDPDFARSLRELGPVQPNPTLSPSSAFPHTNNPNNPSRSQRSKGPDPRTNPAIVVLESRSKLQELADTEFMEGGMRGHPGRQFLDIFTIRQMLVLRDEKRKSAAEIEKALGLKKGTVDRLGTPGVVGLAQESVRSGRVDVV